MRYPECPADVGPGDAVICRSVDGLRPGTPLTEGLTYSIRANDSLGDGEPLQGSRAPVLHLVGIPGTFTPFRFELVTRRAEAAIAEVHETAARMANVMRERVTLSGSCTEHDLARAGFSAAQVIEFADAARGLAGPLSELAAA